MSNNKEYPWYVAGLHFQCVECGNCCSGPEEGYIWSTETEIAMMSEKLDMSVGKFREKYVKAVGDRETLIEEKKSKDCIFLCDRNGTRGCSVYEVRPNQCRTWPFWDMNLDTPEDWNWAAVNCQGINNGRLYTFDEIEQRRTQEKWW